MEVEPRWLPRILVEAIHTDQIREHGGSVGVLDSAMIDSALNRPVDKWHYGGERDPFVLAAAYGFGFAKNHGFRDGNKRTALMAMYTFLGANGIELDAPEPETLAVVTQLAAGDLSESALAEWLRDNSTVS